MSELDKVLTRRRSRAEATGAVFEGGAAEAKGEQPPQGSSSAAAQSSSEVLFEPEHTTRKGEAKGKSKGIVDSPRSSLARLDSPGRARLAASTGSPQQAQPAATAATAAPPAAPSSNGASAATAEPLSVPILEGASPPAEPRDSEISRSTADAGFLAQDQPATAPASPAGSSRCRYPTEVSEAVVCEAPWNPSSQLTGSSTPTPTRAHVEERAAMSSSSYFRPYTRTQQLAPRVPEQLAGQMEELQQPFPKAKEAVLQKKLGDASWQVSSLCDLVSQALSRSCLHPAEVQQICTAAQEIQHSVRLTDAELERIGWPTKALQQMRETLGHLENWQQCEEEANRAIKDARTPLPVALKALEDTLTAWCRLSSAAQGPLQMDLSLERRAKGALPMVSALLDQTMALVRRKPDVFVMRQLEALLRHTAAQAPLNELGASPLLSQALQELDDSAQGLPQGTARAPAMTLSAPEVVWRSIVDGDVRAIESIIYQGGLVSGRTCDPQGHSVFWDAVAFNSPDVALLLMRAFPPDMAHGVDVGELHPRNGNSLLHLVCGLQTFTPQAEGLFAMLFERSPAALRAHRNARGQTFLHVAAGRMHTWILKFAAVRGLEALFETADSIGWTPRSLLAHHVMELQVPRRQPEKPEGSAHVNLPPWCRLAAMQPPTPGSQPPFSDVIVEVEDELQGKVELHAHCVILAGCSSVWHQMLRTSARELRETEAQDSQVKLRLDPGSCSNVEVALFTLRFLYTGEMDCRFRADLRLMLQLVRLCASCLLPAPLRSFAMSTLLQCLETTTGKEAAVLVCQAEDFGLGPLERCQAARRFFASDEAWHAVEPERRGQAIEAALDALQPCLGAAEKPSLPANPLATMPFVR